MLTVNFTAIAVNGKRDSEKRGRLEYRTISHRTVHALPVGDKDAVYWDRKL